MKKRDIITIGILLIIFGILLVIMLINKNNNEDKTSKTEFKTLSLLTDESTFISIEKKYPITKNSIMRYMI